jgi:MoaA/NifB/PqqE/SkfB family radical SAM enzyme
MELSGLHLLLTCQCNISCDHCFVWGGPRQEGTMTLKSIEEILRQGGTVPSVRSIYFEGGEPFLYYPILAKGVLMAADRGFSVGIVTNAYWATDARDAEEWLRPLAGLIDDLSVSSDLYHESEPVGLKAGFAREAAEKLGIPVGVISIAQPKEPGGASPSGQLDRGMSSVMYKGRAAVNLAPKAVQRPWSDFTECPYEDLEEPGRVHVDPFGNIHICQGISVGNLFRTPLAEICERYETAAHPVAGPLHAGGPVELIARYGLQRKERYADACHMCYEARLELRSRFMDILTPDQMYGEPP